MNREIQLLQEDYDRRLHDEVTDVVQGSGKEYPYIQRKIKISGNVADPAYLKKIEERIRKLQDIQVEILDTINAVESPVLRALLFERYICLKKWDQIAQDLHYSESYVKGYLHNRALEAVKKILKTEK